MSEIVLENIGPIVSLRVEIPEDVPGGVIRLIGDQGVGKSAGVNAIRGLLGNKMRIVPREIVDSADGSIAHKKGTVTLGDRKLTVDGKTTRKGELDYGSIEDGFDIGDLISPGYESVDARNATRIKALIDVAGVKPDLSMFYELVGGKARIDQLLPPKDQAITDLVALCGKLKRALEDEAKVAETARDNAERNRVAAEAAADGVDLDAEANATTLLGAFQQATRDAERLSAQRSSFSDAKDKADAARRKLKDHEAKASTSVDQASETYDKAVADETSAEVRVRRLQAELKQASIDLEKATQAKHAARLVLDAASEMEGTVAAWREQVEAAEQVPNPTDEEIAAAVLAIEDAQAAIDRGALVRNALAKKEEAEKLEAARVAAEAKATELRAQARGVYDVLANQIPAGPLYVDAGQLVIDTADRKAEPYDQLSDGERAKIAVPYAVDAVGDGGMICLPQPLWDGFSIGSKKWIADYACDHGVWVITGEIGSGGLRAEVFDSSAT